MQKKDTWNWNYPHSADMIKTYVSALLIFFMATAVARGQQQGLFLNDFQTRSAEIPISYTEVEKPTGPSTATVHVDFTDVVTPVSQYLFGNNANIFMTQMVDQPVLLDHIKTLSPHVLRFPGGNLSSVYLWNSPVGEPPADAPDNLIDAGGAEIDPDYWWGTNTDSWTLSVDNYYSMLEETNTTGIITINYGYARYSTAPDPVAAAAHLAADWVRYDNGRTKFWEIGNESNGTWQAGYRINTANNHDGQPQIISGELYGKHFKVFADSMRTAALEVGATIYIGAQVLAEEPASWLNNTDRFWNDGVFQQAQDVPDYYIIHSYYTPYQANSSAADILNSGSTVTSNMMEFVLSSMADAGVSSKPVALTEWNIFAEGSKQQVSYISGVHAAIVLGELIQNQYGLACRWDLANGWANGNDHGLFSQGDEPGVPKWHPRPTYYYMYYFQKYMGDHLLGSTVSGNPDVLAYATKYSSGEAALVVINKSKSAQTINVNLNNFGYGDRFYFHSLRGGTDNGEFSSKVFVNDVGPGLPSGGPPDLSDVKAWSASVDGGVKFTAPPRSAQYLLIESGDRTITGNIPEEEMSIQVYPNPGENNFQISLPSVGFSKLEILDATGAKMYDYLIALSQTSIQVRTDLAPGVYSVRLYRGGHTFHKKIVVY